MNVLNVVGHTVVKESHIDYVCESICCLVSVDKGTRKSQVTEVHFLLYTCGIKLNPGRDTVFVVPSRLPTLLHIHVEYEVVCKAITVIFPVNNEVLPLITFTVNDLLLS